MTGRRFNNYDIENPVERKKDKEFLAIKRIYVKLKSLFPYLHQNYQVSNKLQLCT